MNNPEEKDTNTEHNSSIAESLFAEKRANPYRSTRETMNEIYEEASSAATGIKSIIETINEEFQSAPVENIAHTFFDKKVNVFDDTMIEFLKKTKVSDLENMQWKKELSRMGYDNQLPRDLEAIELFIDGTMLTAELAKYKQDNLSLYDALADIIKTHWLKPVFINTNPYTSSLSETSEDQKHKERLSAWYNKAYSLACDDTLSPSQAKLLLYEDNYHKNDPDEDRAFYKKNVDLIGKIEKSIDLNSPYAEHLQKFVAQKSSLLAKFAHKNFSTDHTRLLLEKFQWQLLNDYNQIQKFTPEEITKNITAPEIEWLEKKIQSLETSADSKHWVKGEKMRTAYEQIPLTERHTIVNDLLNPKLTEKSKVFALKKELGTPMCMHDGRFIGRLRALLVYFKNFFKKNDDRLSVSFQEFKTIFAKTDPKKTSPKSEEQESLLGSKKSPF